MKNTISCIWLSAILSAAVLTASCQTISSAISSSDSPSIEGSWKLLHEEIRFGDQVYPVFDPTTRDMVKIFNHDRFAFTSIGKNRPPFTSYQPADAEKVVAFDNFTGGAGRYTYEDGYLTEHIEHLSIPNYEGVSIRFQITFKEDTMIQEGMYPIKAMGLGEADGYLYSVFKRIDYTGKAP